MSGGDDKIDQEVKSVCSNKPLIILRDRAFLPGLNKSANRRVLTPPAAFSEAGWGLE